MPFRMRTLDKRRRDGWEDVEIVHSARMPPKWKPHIPFIFDLRVDMARILSQLAVCFYCRSAIEDFLRPCNCGEAEKKGLALKLAIPHDEYFDQIVLQFSRSESRKEYAQYRLESIKESDTHHTKAEIAKLFELQEGCCWFCGKKFPEKNGKLYYHKEHYVPIVRGGSDDVHNIVLACQPCNQKKQDMLGDDFEDIMAKKRSLRVNWTIWRIRDNMDKWIDATYLKKKGKRAHLKH